MLHLALLVTLLLPGLAVAQPAATAHHPLARHLDRALVLDATYRALQAQREAAAARGAQVASPIAGSPALSGSFRADTRGFNRAREMDLEFGAPIWLPGQRGALGASINASVEEYEQRIAQRRLEVAGLLRDAWWMATQADRGVELARDRVATARDIARDVARRSELGDIPPSEALIARNETLAAELELAQAEASAEQARAAYALLTGVPFVAARPEAPARRNPAHPALAAAQAGLATAEAQVRLVVATPRENPELAVFGRRQDGPVTEEGLSLGLRLRLPLATEARNRPRIAAAEAELTQATARMAATRRLVEGEISAATAALRASEQALRIARERLAVADRQMDAARRTFRAGETGLFDLYRVRQLQLEAAGAEVRAEVAVGQTRSRLNQALGAVPE
jgi:outer membrane protein, heavy metal efflux system